MDEDRGVAGGGSWRLALGWQQGCAGGSKCTANRFSSQSLTREINYEESNFPSMCCKGFQFSAHSSVAWSVFLCHKVSDSSHRWWQGHSINSANNWNKSIIWAWLSCSLVESNLSWVWAYPVSRESSFVSCSLFTNNPRSCIYDIAATASKQPLKYHSQRDLERDGKANSERVRKVSVLSSKCKKRTWYFILCPSQKQSNTVYNTVYTLKTWSYN